jgi:hypothetical protein
MSQLAIARGSACCDKGRTYEIIVDGRVAGEVLEGCVRTVAVSPGMHSVQLRIDWCTSEALEVEVARGRTELVSCKPRFNRLLRLFAKTVFYRSYIWAAHAAGKRRAPRLT